MTRGADTREKLLQAAADLIWRNSYHSTGVEAICQASGVQKGCFYHHFESKEALTLACLDMIWAQFKAFLDEAFSPALDPADRFAKYLAGSLESQKQALKAHGRVRGCPLFGLGSELGTQEENLRRRIDEILAVMTRYFATAIRDGQADGTIAPGHPQTLANMVLSLTEGAMTLARIQNDLAPIRELETGVFRLLGIGTRKSKAA